MPKKKMWFPTPYTLVFCLIILAVVLTHVIPAGHYDYKIEGSNTIVKAADVEKYTGKDRLVPIPGTYTRVAGNPQSITSVFLAPIKGMADAIDIITFVLMIGAFITITMKTGAIDAGIMRIINKLQGKEIIMIPILIILFSIGGTVEGMQEETIAFYPVLIPIMVKAGYDPIVAIATILVAAVMGIFASVINPFATGIAAKFAGISIGDGLIFRLVVYVLVVAIASIYIMRYARKIKKDITKSLVYDQLDGIKKRYSISENNAGDTEFTVRHKIILIFFALIFIVMIYGILPFGQFGHPKLELGWWFTELSALFLFGTIVIGIVGRLKEVDIVSAIKIGLSDFVPVGFVIALSRGITVVLRDAALQDTILNSASHLLSGMSPVLFLIIGYFFFLGLAFIITSTSALATITMPILAPLAGMLGVSKAMLITSYLAAQGTVFIVNPSDPILNAAISFGNVGYPQWFRFIAPLIIIVVLLSFVLLAIGNSVVH